MTWFFVFLFGFPVACATEKLLIVWRWKVGNVPQKERDATFGLVGLAELIFYVWFSMKLWEMR